MLFLFLLQNDEGSSQIRIKVISGKSLAKKDIFGARYEYKWLIGSKNTYLFINFSDPYVRIDLNQITGDVNIDSVLTKTKKKVISN